MSVQLNLPDGQPVTMSSLEIADLCGKRHDHVLRDIRKMLMGLYGDEAVNAGLPDRDKYEAFFDKMGWGIDTPDLGNGRVEGIKVRRDTRGFVAEISLDYNHTVTLIAGYKVKLRKAIIDKWQQLEEKEAARPAQQIDLNDPAQLRGLLLNYSERAEQLEKRVEELSHAEEELDRIAQADGSLNITEAAKALQVRPKDLFAWLSQNGWIYKRTGSSTWLGYQSKTVAGFLEHKVTTVLRADGSERVSEQVRVTPRGLTRLARVVPSAVRELI